MQPWRQLSDSCSLAFPHSRDTPAHRSKFGFGLPITLPVAGKLWQPVFLTTGRHICPATSFVLMPKAAVHLDRLSATRKDDVWCPWKVATVQSEPVAHGVQQAPDSKLRPRVFATHRGHEAAACFAGEPVRHACELTLLGQCGQRGLACGLEGLGGLRERALRVA